MSLKTPMKNTLSRLAAFATIATSACATDAAVSNSMSSADAHNTADSGNLGDISKNIGTDVSGVLSNDVKVDQDASAQDALTQQDSIDAGNVKKCGVVKIDYNWPSTCIDTDFDDYGKEIGPAKIQTVLKTKVDETVYPLHMYTGDGKGMDSAFIGNKMQEITCPTNAKEVNVRLPILSQEGGQKLVKFSDIPNQQLFTIGVESGKDCGFEETHFRYVAETGDIGLEYIPDGSVEMPYILQVCDGKGLEKFPEGVTCK